MNTQFTHDMLTLLNSYGIELKGRRGMKEVNDPNPAPVVKVVGKNDKADFMVLEDQLAIRPFGIKMLKVPGTMSGWRHTFVEYFGELSILCREGDIYIDRTFESADLSTFYLDTAEAYFKAKFEGKHEGNDADQRDRFTTLEQLRERTHAPLLATHHQKPYLIHQAEFLQDLDTYLRLKADVIGLDLPLTYEE